MKFVLYAMFVTLMAVACSTSKITTAWKSSELPPENYKKIIVLAMVNKGDRSIQQKMETHFVGDLQDRKYAAVSALDQYGPKAFDKLTEAEIIPTLKTSGADAMITIVLINSHRERTYVPGPGSSALHVGRYVRDRYNAINDAGYYVTNTKYLWESNLYDLTSGKLLYSVQTVTFSPSSIERMGHEYGRLIVKDMVAQGVLKDHT